jgi:hypothetical protein
VPRPRLCHALVLRVSGICTSQNRRSIPSKCYCKQQNTDSGPQDTYPHSSQQLSRKMCKRATRFFTSLNKLKKKQKDCGKSARYISEGYTSASVPQSSIPSTTGRFYPQLPYLHTCQTDITTFNETNQLDREKNLKHRETSIVSTTCIYPKTQKKRLSLSLAYFQSVVVQQESRSFWKEARQTEQTRK